MDMHSTDSYFQRRLIFFKNNAAITCPKKRSGKESGLIPPKKEQMKSVNIFRGIIIVVRAKFYSCDCFRYDSAIQRDNSKKGYNGQERRKSRGGFIQNLYSGFRTWCFSFHVPSVFSQRWGEAIRYFSTISQNFSSLRSRYSRDSLKCFAGNSPSYL